MRLIGIHMDRQRLIGLVVLAAPVIAIAAETKPLYLVLALAALGLVAMAMTNLAFGVAALTLLAFSERLPGVTGITLTKPLGLVLVVSWLAALSRRDVDVPLLTRDHPVLSYGLFALVAWGAGSAVWAADPGTAIASAVRLALVVVLFFIVYSAVRTPRDLNVVVWSFLLGAFLTSIAALVTGKQVEGRLTAGVLDPNFLAAALASSIVMASFMLTTTRGPTRLLLLGFILTDGVALVLTQSRGGLIAAAVALAVSCVVAGPVRTQAVVIAVMVVSTGLAYYTVLAPASLRQRVADVSAEGSASRTDTWQIALQMSRDHPLLGVGLGNFRVVESRYIPGNLNILRAPEVLKNRLVTHNTYLEVLSELGSVGLILLLGVITAALATAWRGIGLVHNAMIPSSLVARGLVAGTFALLTAYVFLSGEYEKLLWLLLGVLTAIPNAIRATASPTAAATGVVRDGQIDPLTRAISGSPAGTPALPDAL